MRDRLEAFSPVSYRLVVCDLCARPKWLQWGEFPVQIKRVAPEPSLIDPDIEVFRGLTIPRWLGDRIRAEEAQ